MKRTGSMGSCVGPLVINARRPASGRAPPRRAAMAARIAAGSAMRPGPLSPSARGPSSGPTNETPSSARRARLRRVAGWRHIRVFMAGAARTGPSVASSAVVARSSAMPWAIFAMMSAVAGATTARSASRASRI